MFLVRFRRKDNKPIEEYEYNALNDALYHLHLFKNDNSGLYNKIDLLLSLEDLGIEEVLHSISFE